MSRSTTGDEALKKCPEIQLVRVPVKRGKADLTCYREIGAEVIRALARFTEQVERASIDEAYLDITRLVQERVNGGVKVEACMLPATHVAGFGAQEDSCEAADEGREGTCRNEEGRDLTECATGQATREGGCRELAGEWETGGEEEEDNLLGELSDVEEDGCGAAGVAVAPEGRRSRESVLRRWLEEEGCGEEQVLAVGAVIAAEMRAAVLREVGCTCSAGIAHNKVS